MKKIFKSKKTMNELFKLFGIIVVCLLLKNVINSMFLREGLTMSSGGSRPISESEAGPHTDKANSIKNKLKKQTAQSRANHELSQKTLPK